MHWEGNDVVVFLPKTAKATSKHKDTIREICWGLHWPPFFQNKSFVKDKGLELPQLKGDQKDRTTGSWIEFWVSKKKKREKDPIKLLLCKNVGGSVTVHRRSARSGACTECKCWVTVHTFSACDISSPGKIELVKESECQFAFSRKIFLPQAGTNLSGNYFRGTLGAVFLKEGVLGQLAKREHGMYVH